MSNKLPKKLKTLFWDFDYKKINIKKHRQFVVERLLEKGKMEHVIWLYENYDPEFIQSVISSSHSLSPKTRNFWNVIYN